MKSIAASARVVCTPQRRVSARKMAVWLTSQDGAAMSQRELASFFGRSGSGWICHVVKGRWHAIRFTQEHAALMRVIYEYERKRLGLPRKVRDKVDELVELHQKAINGLHDLAVMLRNVKYD